MGFARIKLSLASVMSIVILDMTDSTMDAAECNSAGREMGMMGGIRWCECPRWSWNPEYPVEALMVFIMCGVEHIPILFGFALHGNGLIG